MTMRRTTAVVSDPTDILRQAYRDWAADYARWWNESTRKRIEWWRADPAHRKIFYDDASLSTSLKLFEIREPSEW